MKVYLVGGAVRDKLLGKNPQDYDYVVTGASADYFLKAGYQQVGMSFSVFLHPETKSEYSLIRGNTLEDDLVRRDLTINSMAIDENGKLIDPFGGKKDLDLKILRHVSEHFKDDPLRVFRVARFASLHPEFSIHPSTLTMMEEVTKLKSFRELHPERIFQELRSSLTADKPSIFYEILKSVGALEYYFPELHQLIDVPQRADYHPEGDCYIHTMLVLDESAKLSPDLRIRYAALVHDLGKGVTPKNILPKHIGHEERGLPLVKKMGKRLHVPSDWTESALTVTKFHLRVHRLHEMKASSIVRMFYEMDAYRKPFLVPILARACEADEMGKLRSGVKEGELLEGAFEVTKNIGQSNVDSKFEGKALGDAIRAQRVRTLGEWLNEACGTLE